MTSKQYTVSWTIDVEADDPESAAMEAYLLMRKPRTISDPDAAVVFTVDEVTNGPTLSHEVDLFDSHHRWPYL